MQSSNTIVLKAFTHISFSSCVCVIVSCFVCVSFFHIFKNADFYVLVKRSPPRDGGKTKRGGGGGCPDSGTEARVSPDAHLPCT